MAQQFLVRVNNQVCPEEAWPETIHYTSQDGEGARNLLGDPVGGGIERAVTLGWTLIAASGLDFWTQFVGAGNLSVTLSDLVLPDPVQGETISYLSVAYPRHAQWSSARLHALQMDATPVYLEGEMYLRGTIVVTISGLRAASRV